MTKPVLHIPLKDSPDTYLAISINATDTILKLADSSIFQAAGITRLTLGANTPVTETVRVTGYYANDEIIVVRGTPSYSWLAETQVSRVFTAADLLEVQQYLVYLDDALTDVEQDIVNQLVTNGNLHDHDGGDGAQIPSGGITDGAVIATKIGTGAVTETKIGTGAVTETKIGTGAITETKIGTGAVTNTKLGADSVTADKIGDDIINSEHIAAGAIDTEHIADLQVTADKLASGAVTENKILNNAVTTDKILAGAISDAKLASGAVTAPKIDVPFCFVARESSVTVGSTLSSIAFESDYTVEKIDDMWSTGSTTRLYLRTAGWYRISFMVNLGTGGSAGDYRIALVIKNGSTASADHVIGQSCPGSGASAQISLSGSIDYYFSANDYIQLRLQAASNITLGYARMTAAFIRP